jgi:hypothetical protein
MPYFLHNLLTGGGEDDSLTRPPRFTPHPGRFVKLISVKRLSRTQGHSAAGRIGQIENSMASSEI